MHVILAMNCLALARPLLAATSLAVVTACGLAAPCPLSAQSGVDLLFFQDFGEDEQWANMDIHPYGASCRAQGYDVELNGEPATHTGPGGFTNVDLGGLIPARGEPAQDLELTLTDGKTTWTAAIEELLVWRGLAPEDDLWEAPVGEDFVLEWVPSYQMPGSVHVSVCARVQGGYCDWWEENPGDQPLAITLPAMGMYDLMFEVEPHMYVTSCTGAPGCDSQTGAVTGRILGTQEAEVYATP